MMEAYDLRFDPEFNPVARALADSINISLFRKVDSSSTSSPVPGNQSTLLLAVYGTVGPSVVTFGLIGNLIILLVVARSPMSGAIPVYLSALAISDIGALLSSIPLWIRLSEQVDCSYFNAFYYGHLELFILNTFMAASIFTVVALTLERYTSVCWAGRFPSVHTPERAKLAVALGYLVALIISLPLCVLKEVTENAYTSDPDEMPADWCYYKFIERKSVTSHALWTAYVWLGESLVRFLPALILAVLNWLIMMKFRGVVKTRLQMQQNNHQIDAPSATGGSSAAAPVSGNRAERHLEQERKLLTLLLSIIILFFITNIPSAVLSIIYSQELEDLYSFQLFRAIANLLEMSNFALNFCMYFMCSKEFRKMLYKAFPPFRGFKFSFSSRHTQSSSHHTQPSSDRTTSKTLSTKTTPPAV